MKWKPAYAIGVEVIDQQHKKLFDLAEEAERLLELPDYLDKYDEIIEIVQELKDYVVYHFEEEEKFLLEMKYNKFFGHKVHHEDFISEMNQIDIYAIDENQSKELLRITDLITEWLIKHVLGEDRLWAKYYIERDKRQV